MREIVHIQAGQCGNQIGAKVKFFICLKLCIMLFFGNFQHKEFFSQPLAPQLIDNSYRIRVMCQVFSTTAHLKTGYI